MVKKIIKKSRKVPHIGVQCGHVTVVPYHLMQSYFHWEIESEGSHRSDCKPVVLFPRSEAGEATKEWVERIFSDCAFAREHGRKTVRFPQLAVADDSIDIGLLDIPVTFKGDLDTIVANMRHRPREFLEQNLQVEINCSPARSMTK